MIRVPPSDGSKVIRSRETDAGVLAAKGDRVRRVVLDDAVGERRLAVKEVGDEPELASLRDRRVADALGFDDPRIPLRGRREVAEVGEHLVGRMGRVDCCLVAGHRILLMLFEFGVAGMLVPAAESLALGPEPLTVVGRLPGPGHAVGRASRRSCQKPPELSCRLGRGTEPDDRVGALLRRAQQPLCRAVEAWQRGLAGPGCPPSRDASRAPPRRCPQAARAHCSVRITWARLVRA